ncbi:PIN domain-like protein [Pisolithus marmoratus]|nr:PIN domain-like protein [Pisolithus marmoratus]
MGVLGLTPFLLKTCPQVIRKLPDRLKSLRGRTIAIDGTLVTQRLHFAPMPHHHRHVLGWHRIVTELRDFDVLPICVFDGQERSAAKAREASLRKEIHRMERTRGLIEAARLHRLQQLMRLLPHYRSLRASDRQRITETLAQLPVTRLPSAHAMHGSQRCDSTMSTTVDGTPASWSTLPPLPHPHFCEYGGFTEEDLDEVVQAASGESLDVTHHHEASGVWQNEAEQDINALPSSQCARFNAFPNDPDTAPPTVYWADVGEDVARRWSPELLAVSTEPCLRPGDIQAVLSTLYDEYQQGLDQLTSIPSSSSVSVISDVIPDPPETGIEYAMSKSQLQMTIDEGRIWEALATSPLPTELEAILMALARKSGAISYSYHRRTNLPSPETYKECKELLRAMGVPCIETTGPFEAEALASSLVMHGRADFVASEDTDVLVYGAPLLRNIANRDSPLVIVSGSDVYTSLELDRSQFIDFVLLLGTDFSQRIKNVGPQRALRFIKEYGSIERVVENEIKYPPRIPAAAYLAQVEVARMVFKTLPPIPATDLLQPSPEDPAAVSHIIQKCGLHRVLHESWDHEAALAGNYFNDDPSASFA